MCVKTLGKHLQNLELIIWLKGRSFGLVVKGDDSCLRGPGFESRHCKLDFLTLICCKNRIVCLKRPKINKIGRGWPIL